MSVDYARAIPILPSPDIAETRAFYRDALGFSVVGPDIESYLIVRRAEMELHFGIRRTASCRRFLPATSVAVRFPRYTPNTRSVVSAV